MKNEILSMSMLLTIGTTLAFTNPAPVKDPTLQKLFQRKFAGAEDVKWSDYGDYVKANFVLGGHRAEAWFDANGNLIGSVRDLFFNQLPLIVITTLDKRFAEAIIDEVREVSVGGNTSYKIKLEYKGSKYKLSVDAGGSFVSIGKIKKG